MSIIEPITFTPIPQVIAKRLMAMIQEGVWPPGSSLPSQRQLARDLGVAVSSLREALSSLQAIGLVEMRQGEGTFVARNPYGTIERLLGFVISSESLDWQTLFQARSTIEGGLARLAATKATDEQIRAAGLVLSQMKEAVEQGDQKRADELDVRFHHSLAEMAHNEILMQVGQSLYPALERFLRNIPHTLEGWRLHNQVLAAIRARDPERSEKAFHQLLRKTEALYRDCLPPH